MTPGSAGLGMGNKTNRRLLRCKHRKVIGEGINAHTLDTRRKLIVSDALEM